MMTIVPIQLNEMELQKIDFLIKTGKYKNRSQAIRTLLNQRLEQETFSFEWENEEEDQKRNEIVEKLLNQKLPVISWKGPFNAAEYISKFRDER